MNHIVRLNHFWQFHHYEKKVVGLILFQLITWPFYFLDRFFLVKKKSLSLSLLLKLIFFSIPNIEILLLKMDIFFPFVI